MKKTILIMLIMLAFAPVAWGATLYVDVQLVTDCTSGTYSIASRNCSGSDGSAYRTLSAAHSAATASDTVVVRGGTYTASLPVSITKKLTIQAHTGETPVFDGANTYPTGSVPNYNGLIQISGAETVLDGMTITRSRGHGLKVHETGDDVTIQNCTIYLNKSDGVNVIGVDRVTVQDCTLYDNNRMRPDDGSSVSGASIKFVGVGNTGPPATYGVARRNLIYDEWGEGIGFYKMATDCIMEYNVVKNCRSYQLYVSWGPRSVVRYNLVYQTAPKSGYPNSIGGIVVGDEPWQCYPSYRSNDVKIYGNMVLGGKQRALLLRSQVNATDGDACDGIRYPVLDVLVANNTFIGAWSDQTTVTDIQIETQCTGVFKNNIVWGASTGTTIANVPSTITFGNNYWSKIPDADAMNGSSGNIVGFGDPLLEDATVLNWFSALTYGTTLTGGEFALSSGSKAIGAGAVLGSDYDDGLNLRETDFTAWTFDLMDRDDHNDGKWSIGADVYSVDDGTPPGTVTGLSCSAVNAQRVDCSWNAVSGATSYKLYRKAKSGECSTADLTAITGITATTYSLENLTVNQAWCWYAKATNSDGDSASYSSVSEPTTPAVTADLLNHLVSESGLTGLTQTQGGTATVTENGTSIRLYDPDSTSSPDNRAMISKVLGNIGGSWTAQFKGTLTDTPGTYSGSAPLRFLGIYVANGVRSNRVRITRDGIRVRDAAGDTLQADTAAFVDTDEHTWLIQFDGSTNQLTIKQDGDTVKVVSNAGVASTWDGGWGMEANGTATDAADMSVKWMQVGNGVGTMDDPEDPVMVSGELKVELR